MYLTITTSKGKKGQQYRSVLLRECYREDGKIKNRTIANLKNCSDEEIEAIRVALKHKKDLTAFKKHPQVISLRQGPSVGAVWAVYQVARKLGIDKALGNSFSAQLALWQVIARVIDQGSRLSATRLVKLHACCEVLGICRGFDENDLYDNLGWLADNQDDIEKALFSIRHESSPELLLYDVTSTYLEGDQNALAAFGYNRDKKRGKKQIVIGLLCDAKGEPVSTRIFTGNTSDPSTFNVQVDKALKGFGCQRLVFVGDRGMIKSKQIEKLLSVGCHYISALTKPQIESLIKKQVIEMSQFDENLCEIGHAEERFVLRRNPKRVEEIQRNRNEKLTSVKNLVQEKQMYLHDHPRAKALIAVKDIEKKINKLNIKSWLAIDSEGTNLKLLIDQHALDEISAFDGCYAIRTDVPQDVMDKDAVHARYKDLIQVEWAFRTCKTAHLELRPVYVRSSKSTQGHVLVVMLAYMIVRHLHQSWAELNITAEEGVKSLSTLCAVEVDINGKGSCLQIPGPSNELHNLLKILGITLPSALPASTVNVVTRKKLSRRC